MRWDDLGRVSAPFPTPPGPALQQKYNRFSEQAIHGTRKVCCMASTVFDLINKYAVERGEPWRLKLTHFCGPAKQPVDLTGLQARFDVLNGLGEEVLLSVTPMLGGGSGTIEINITGEQTTRLNKIPLRYRLRISDGSAEWTLIRGRLSVVD